MIGALSPTAATNSRVTPGGSRNCAMRLRRGFTKAVMWSGMKPFPVSEWVASSVVPSAPGVPR